MRVLNASYSVEGSNTVLFITIIDNNMNVVTTEQIDDIVSKKQANKLCKQIYKKYNCDKIMLEGC